MNVINVYKLYDDIEIPKLQTKKSACFDIPALISEKEQVLSYSKQNNIITVFAGKISSVIESYGDVLNEIE